MNDFSLLEQKLNLKFNNQDLLIQAFTHRSYLNENKNLSLSHNERLEFLGDAVLELVITEYLYLNYPKKTEGELTSWRAALVNGNILGEIGEKLGFNDFVLLSSGEKKEKGKARKYILAKVFEAFIGALYLDQGIKSCYNLIQEALISQLEFVIEKGLHKSAKSRFQEKAQEIIGVTPHYSLLEESGPDHKKSFIIGVFLEKDLVARAQGSSKQEAEEKAAQEALKIKEWNNN
ncbi:MAG: ribonuclease III [Candidatus Pacebacteria bacterium]|nr:ribonuclease III [Candidatus Paceibacterota bacterium]